MGDSSRQELHPLGAVQLEQGTYAGQAIHHHGPVNYISHVDNAHFGINHGQILQNSYQSLPFAPEHYLPFLMPITDASHTRNRRTSPPDSDCLPGTRIKVIQEILAWAEDIAEPGIDGCSDLQSERSAQSRDGVTVQHSPPFNRPVLWLCGPVGCGKSAIAQTVAEELERRQCLAGSFFFFRGSESRSRFSRFIVTLARQIAMAIPEAEPTIEKAMRSTGLHGVSVWTQLERLIFDPFLNHTAEQSTGPATSSSLEAPSRRVFIIVIDGFDECEDREDVADFITHILEFFERHPKTPLRFLISSRIEENIRQRIVSNQVLTVKLGDYSSYADIRSLVCHTFSLAAKRSRVIAAYGADWPGKFGISSLVQRADGSFIFIKTLLDFILGVDSSPEDGRTPIDRFDEALKMNGLDSLYNDVLRRAKHIPHFPDVVLANAALSGEATICDLALLLGIPPYKVVQVITPLQSIIRVPEDDDTTPIALFHTSLRDFMLDSGRCTIVTQDQRDRHDEVMAFRLLDIHLAMGARDICDGDGLVIRLAKRTWERHWTLTTYRDDDAFLRKMDHIFGLREAAPPTDILLILAFCYWELLQHQKASNLADLHSPLKSILHSMPMPYYMPWLSREGVVLRKAFSTLANCKPFLFLQDVNRRWESLSPIDPGPAVRKRVALHSIILLLGVVDETETAESVAHYLSSCPHPLQTWLRYFCLSIDECHAGAELHEFLNTTYRGPLGQSTAVTSMGREEMDSDINLAMQNIGSKLPVMLARKSAVTCNGDSNGILQKRDGLTIVDMLDIFCFLRIPEDYPAFRCRTVIVDIGQPNRFQLCSWLTASGRIHMASYPYL